MSLQIQDRRTLAFREICIDFRGCRRDVVAYVARAFPGCIVTRFDAFAG